MHVRGIWQDDKRFGPQVKVALATPVAPSGEVALMAYLKRVKHVGGARAARLIERYGEGVLEAIDRDPVAAFRSIGFSPKRVNEAIRSWNALRSTRSLHLLLAPHGLAWLVPKIAAEYGDHAHDVVRTRPYELTNVFGVGFHIADTIARAAGVPADSVGRRRAAIAHVLSEAEREGSTCLPVPELAGKAAALLGGFVPDASLLSAMADAGQIVLEIDDDVRCGPTGRSPPSSRRSWPQPFVRWRRASPSLEAPDARGRRSRARRGTGGGREGRVRLATVDRHRRSGHRQDRDDPADLRGGEGAERLGRAGRADRPRRAADGGVDGRGGVDDPFRARLDSRRGPDPRRDQGRPAGGRRDVDGQPRAARHAAAGGRAGHARRARRRRRSARARRRRQAVRGAGGDAAVPGRRAHPHLPPGGREHDRARRARGPPRPPAVVRGQARTSSATCS